MRTTRARHNKRHKLRIADGLYKSCMHIKAGCVKCGKMEVTINGFGVCLACQTESFRKPRERFVNSENPGTIRADLRSKLEDRRIMKELGLPYEDTT